jgi:hypothetical protein
MTLAYIIIAVIAVFIAGHYHGKAIERRNHKPQTWQIKGSK